VRWISTLAVILTFALSSPALSQATPVGQLMADRVLGNAEAPVTIITYESFTCPHCAAFHVDTFDDLKERYIDTGQVKMIFRDFPLDARALRASMLARCVAPQQFYGMVKVLFRSQDKWARDPDLNGALGQLGRFAGVNEETFDACMANEELLDALVLSRQEASDIGVRSTPTFEINGELYPGNRSLEDFARIIDPLLPSN